MGKSEFKEFARKHPELAMQVSKGEYTWQKLYEIYDIYGDDNEIWKDYFKTSNFKMSELLGTLKNINLDEVKEGINNIEKVLTLLGDMSLKKTNYKPRPMYKHFDD